MSLEEHTSASLSDDSGAGEGSGGQGAFSDVHTDGKQFELGLVAQARTVTHPWCKTPPPPPCTSTPTAAMSIASAAMAATAAEEEEGAVRVGG